MIFKTTLREKNVVDKGEKHYLANYEFPSLRQLAPITVTEKQSRNVFPGTR